MNLSAAVVISVVSLCVSSVALVYTVRSFTVTQRPYIGIVETDITVDRPPAPDNPPTALQYAFVFKNVGALPARLTVQVHRATLTTGGKTVEVPSIAMSNISIVMPGQPSPLIGRINDKDGFAKVADVLAGRTTLDVEISISYAAVSGYWWPSTHTYRTKQRFRFPESPHFIPVFYDVN